MLRSLLSAVCQYTCGMLGVLTEAFTDDLKSQLLDMGICKVLIPLTKSSSIEVQGNSAAALGNLSSKGNLDPINYCVPLSDGFQ